MTLQAVTQLSEMAVAAGVRVNFFVLDDASGDGTANALAAVPDVTVLSGDGSYYWARGMAEAEKNALKHGERFQPDYLLWVNDDVSFDRDALESLIDGARQHPGALIVGSCRDPRTGETTYGGYKRYDRHHPLHLGRVAPEGRFLQVDTMNGNVVLIPLAVARDLGGIDGRFSHSWADIDYGLRAKKAGYQIVLLPRHVGSCARNPQEKLSLRADFRAFVGPKGPGNVKSLARILRRNAGLTWPIYLAGTYVLWILRRAVRSV